VIIADAAVWSKYLGGVGDRYTRRLTRALEDEEDVALIADGVPELLAGFRDDALSRKAAKLLLGLPIISPSIGTRADAAALERKLRGQRVKMLHPMSCLMAQVCLELDSEVLSPIADYSRIAKAVRLKVCYV
jgi:hypothetical protein